MLNPKQKATVRQFTQKLNAAMGSYERARNIKAATGQAKADYNQLTSVVTAAVQQLYRELGLDVADAQFSAESPEAQLKRVTAQKYASARRR